MRGRGGGGPISGFGSQPSKTHMNGAHTQIHGAAHCQHRDLPLRKLNEEKQGASYTGASFHAGALVFYTANIGGARGRGK